MRNTRPATDPLLFRQATDDRVLPMNARLVLAMILSTVPSVAAAQTQTPQTRPSSHWVCTAQHSDHPGSQSGYQLYKSDVFVASTGSQRVHWAWKRHLMTAHPECYGPARRPFVACSPGQGDRMPYIPDPPPAARATVVQEHWKYTPGVDDSSPPTAAPAQSSSPAAPAAAPPSAGPTGPPIAYLCTAPSTDFDDSSQSFFRTDVFSSAGDAVTVGRAWQQYLIATYPRRFDPKILSSLAYARCSQTRVTCNRSASEQHDASEL
jgi:hypothetical protein